MSPQPAGQAPGSRGRVRRPGRRGDRGRFGHRPGHRPAARRARRAGGGARPQRRPGPGCGAGRAGEAPIRAGATASALHAVIADVTDDDAVRTAVGEAAAVLGGIDILVNNAGIGAIGSVEDNDDDEWRHVLDVNVLGMVRTTRAALPWLRRAAAARGQAAIVNTCSVAATAGLPQRALYSASKGAVYSLTMAMAADHAREKIRVTCVNPGTADTPWIARLLGQSPDPAAERAALEARQPIGRMVSAEEVAAAIAYLASPSAGSDDRHVAGRQRRHERPAAAAARTGAALGHAGRSDRSRSEKYSSKSPVRPEPIPAAERIGHVLGTRRPGCPATTAGRSGCRLLRARGRVRPPAAPPARATARAAGCAVPRAPAIGGFLVRERTAMPGNDQPTGRPERPEVPGRPGQSHVSRRSLLGAAGVGAAGLAAVGTFGGLAAAPAVAAAAPGPRRP